MSESPGDGPLTPADLGGNAVLVYYHVLKVGEFRAEDVVKATGLPPAEVSRCRDELERFCLLARMPGLHGRLLPVSPEVAAARFTEPLEERIRSFRSSVDATRERLLQLMPAYLSRSAQATADLRGALEEVSDAGDVQLLINTAVHSCTKEMMTVQPGGRRDPALLQEALTHDLAAAKRGVRVRVLYQHTIRSMLDAHAYVTAMTEAGGEVRTVDQLPERMLIFDRELAFIPKRTKPGAPGALVVRDPVIVSFLCAFFEQFWVSATRFVPEGPGYQSVSGDLQRSILQLLAQGLKDEAVAKRMGMSVRTCRRHIASLMQELDAESRFEAGVKAAQLGLLRETPES